MIMTEQEIDYQGDGSAEDVLRWAIEKFDRRIVLACSFQMNALIHMVLEIRPDVTLFAIDTGRLNEETYECARDVERRYGIKIRWYFPRHVAVEGLIRNKGLFSFRESVDNRKECCYIRKVEPLNRALSEFDCWISGLRRDQSNTRQDVKQIEIDNAHGGMLKVNPIINWTTDRVRAYVKEHKIPYNRLMEQGYLSIGCAPCTRPVKDGEHPRSGRWWWESDDHAECGMHVRNWNI